MKATVPDKGRRPSGRRTRRGMKPDKPPRGGPTVPGRGVYPKYTATINILKIEKLLER
jgi:hypothetical protein